MKTAADTKTEGKALERANAERRLMRLVSSGPGSGLRRSAIRISLCENLSPPVRDVLPPEDTAKESIGKHSDAASGSSLTTLLAIAGAIGFVAGILIGRRNR